MTAAGEIQQSFAQSHFILLSWSQQKGETDEPYRMHCVTKARAADSLKYDLNFDTQLGFLWNRHGVKTKCHENVISECNCLLMSLHILKHIEQCGPFDMCAQELIFVPSKATKNVLSSSILTNCFILCISHNLFQNKWDQGEFSEKGMLSNLREVLALDDITILCLAIQGLCNLSRASGLNPNTSQGCLRSQDP